jgi:hypothetical protein
MVHMVKQHGNLQPATCNDAPSPEPVFGAAQYLPNHIYMVPHLWAPHGTKTNKGTCWVCHRSCNVARCMDYGVMLMLLLRCRHPSQLCAWFEIVDALTACSAGLTALWVGSASRGEALASWLAADLS